MTIKGWDVLWEHFHDIVEWWNLEMFAYQFEDVVAAKTLTVFSRYGSRNSSVEGAPTWNLPDLDVCQECPLATLQGFIAVLKGYSEPVTPSITVEKGITKETHTRCYLVGRMSKEDPLARQLAQELGERVARFEVLVYDRQKQAAGDREVVVSTLTDQNPWISRYRTAPTKEELTTRSWITSNSLDNTVRHDLQVIHSERDRNMASHYYEFIIIDKTARPAFDIIDVVADALHKLKGDPPYDILFRQAIEKYAPAESRARYVGITSQIDFPPNILSPPLYVGNRVRCWDIGQGPNSLQDILRPLDHALLRPKTLSESRIICKISTDLEAHDAVSQIKKFESPITYPLIIPGVDGLDDLYFYHHLGPMEHPIDGTILDVDLSSKSLVEFAMSYHLAHPNAVFCKGRINIPYCAWPIPYLAGSKHSGLTFCTAEGKMYRWKALPFDFPLASRIWQGYVNEKINLKLPFVRLVQTTLVVCAESRDAAEANSKALFDVGKEHGWTFSIPSPATWTTDPKALRLELLWQGVQPVLP